MSLFYDEKTVEVLKRNLEMSDKTWHKVMNPMCGACMLERGHWVLEPWKEEMGGGIRESGE